MVRVLYAIGYPQRFNGAQRSLLSLLCELPAHGVEPVAAFTGRGICVDEYARAGVRTRVLDLPDEARVYGKQWLSGGVVSRILRLLRLYPTLIRTTWQLLADVRPAVVHCNEPRALFIIGVSARLRGTPVVLHLRGSADPYPRPLRVAIQLLPSRIVAVGPSIRRELAGVGRRKCSVVYNPIPMPDAPPRSDTGDVVLTLASITPHKGHHHLIDAMRILADDVDGPKIRARIRGQVLDVAYERELRRRIADYGLTNVDLCDWTDDVARELDAAAVVVSASVERELIRIEGRAVEVANAEGTSRQLLEALAARVPVVATRIPGTVDVIDHERTGLLVEPGSPAALASALRRLLGDPDEAARLSEEGRRVVATRHAPGASAAAVAAIYRDVV